MIVFGYVCGWLSLVMFAVIVVVPHAKEPASGKRREILLEAEMLYDDWSLKVESILAFLDGGYEAQVFLWSSHVEV